MKKSISVLINLLISVGSALSLTAQSPVTNVNQVELMKKFAGTWQAEVGEDTAIVVTFKPYGIALKYERVVTIKVSDGEHEYYLTGIYGFSEDMNSVIFAGVQPTGSLILDYGRFTSDKKYISESYLGNEKHPIAIEEVEFISPDTMEIRSKYRGDALTWDVPWSPVVTFIRKE